MDLTTLTYINTVVILVALVTMALILYAIRREHTDLLLRIDERSNMTVLQTAATLEIARKILEQPSR
jgi:hypothetical protein